MRPIAIVVQPSTGNKSMSRARREEEANDEETSPPKSGVKALLGSLERRSSMEGTQKPHASNGGGNRDGDHNDYYDSNSHRNENNQNLRNTRNSLIHQPPPATTSATHPKTNISHAIGRPRSVVVIERFARPSRLSSSASVTSSTSSSGGGRESPAATRPVRVNISRLRKNYEAQSRQDSPSSSAPGDSEPPPRTAAASPRRESRRIRLLSRYPIHKAEPASDAASPPPVRRSTGSPREEAEAAISSSPSSRSNQRIRMLRKSFERSSLSQPPRHQQQQCASPSRASEEVPEPSRLPSPSGSSSEATPGESSTEEKHTTETPSSPETATTTATNEAVEEEEEEEEEETPTTEKLPSLPLAMNSFDSTATTSTETTRESAATATLLQPSPSLASNASDGMSELHMDEMSVMAMLIKPPTPCNLGISFQKRGNWRILVSELLPSPQGMLSKSDLKVGQTLLAVNGIPANDFASVEEIRATLHNARKVAIVATKSVLVTVDRRTLDEEVGLTLVQVPPPGGTTHAALVIAGVSADGLVAPHKTTGVLQPGMKIIAINGQAGLSQSTAKRMLRETIGRLSILAVQDDAAMQALRAHSNHHHPHHTGEDATALVASSSSSSSTSSGIETTKLAIPLPSLNLYLEESSAMGMAIKPTRDSLLGIGFVKRPIDGRMLITEIYPDSLLANSDLRVGQTLLAVNGIPASEFVAAKEVVALIRRTKEVAIVATKSILASVEKPTVDTRVGIAFCKSRRDGILSIYKIAPNGLFGQNGLLEVGMKVVAINHKPCPGSLEAANTIVKECSGTLTILAVHDDDDSAAGVL